MGGNSKKGSDQQDIPQIDPNALIQQAIQANRVGVNTPFGSQTYSTDANGNAVLNTQYSPQMQALFNEQMARAGGAANQYALPSQNADILNGLNTRLSQRYGIPVPTTPTSGGTPGPGAGGGPGPGGNPIPPPVAPPPGAPPPVTQPPITGPGAIPRGGYNDIGGNDNCVAVDSWLPGGVRADKVKPNDTFPVHTPEQGFHDWHVEQNGYPAFEPVVQLTTQGGAVLRCSESTPFTLPSAQTDLEEGHTKLARQMQGETVFVHTPEGVMTDVVTQVEHLGKGWVQPLSFGGRSFPAGDTPDKLIYSHNIMKGSQASYTPTSGGADYTWGTEGASLGGFSPLTGSVDQGQNTIAQNNAYVAAGNAYTPAGGYLGSGSYDSMGAGLGAAGYGDKAPQTNVDYNTGAPGSSYSGAHSSLPASAFGGFGLPAPPSYEGMPMETMPQLPGPAHQNKFVNWLEHSKVVPTLATLLGGPLAGVAARGGQKYATRNEGK